MGVEREKLQCCVAGARPVTLRALRASHQHVSLLSTVSLWDVKLCVSHLGSNGAWNKLHPSPKAPSLGFMGKKAARRIEKRDELNITSLEPVSLNEWQKVQASPGVPQCLPRTYLHIQDSYIIFLATASSDLPVTPKNSPLRSMTQDHGNDAPAVGFS